MRIDMPNRRYRLLGAVELRDRDEPRDWQAIWREPARFFLPNCPCCPGASQTYHCIGGLTSGTPSTRRNTNYEYTIDAWTAKAVTWAAVEALAGATPTTSGPLYVYGGISSSSPFFLTRSDSYLPDAWSTNTAMPGSAVWAAAGCAIAGLCYSFGGNDSASVPQTQTAQMTPGSPSTWAARTGMTQARGHGGATYIGSKGYHFGGDNASGTQTSTNYEYDPSGDSWATKTAVPNPAVDGMAVFTIAGHAYVIDGGNIAVAQNNSYVVDTWTVQAAPPSAALRQYVAGASDDAGGVGRITGGLVHTGATVATHEEYVPNTWATRANLPITIEDAIALFA
jgi:hypothetical protein